MDFQRFYQEAKKDGYSDEETTEYLLKNEPSFEKFIQESKEEGYSPEEVLSYLSASPKKREEGALETYGKDVLEQGAQGIGLGALGTYGDILDLLGLQSKDLSPSDKAKYGRESESLEKMQKGKNLSSRDLLQIAGDEDILPSFTRVPTPRELEKSGKESGIISEPKTPAGRYAKRIGRIWGGGVSLGSAAILSPIAAGAAGQTAEELGLPPWVQAAFELIAGIKAAPKSKVPITSDSKQVENTIKSLREAGYSDEAITLAKNALEDRNILKKFATLTPKAENAIQKGVKESEHLFKEQVKKGLPGYAEGGIPYLEKQASNVYQTMENLASTVPIKNKEPVKKAVEGAIAYLEKYPLLDEQKKFIEFMKDGLKKLHGADTAEFFTGFYRNLGKAGNWGNPSQKEKLLGMVKDGIKQTFAESGPEAAKFGKYFEKTNEAWKHWLNARDLMETIEKAYTVDGINFKKLTKILSDPENHDLAKKVLGPEQVENIKTINKGAEAIESLMKQIKPSDKTSSVLKALEAARAFLTGSWKTFGALMGFEAAKILSTRLLFDPKKQNIMKKFIIAAKNNAPQEAGILARELVEEPDENRNTNQNL